MGIPTVSWLISVYNAESYLKRALDSIINQSFCDYEVIIVVEYNCTDKTLQICKEYANDERFRIICNNERLGFVRSLNIGLQYCKGKYIARMDADDVSYYDRLEKQVAFMDANDEVGILCSERKCIRNDSSYYLTQTPSLDEFIKVRLLFGFCLNHPTMMLRSELFKKNGWCYPTDLEEAEDYALCISLLLKVKFYCLSDILVDYYEHGQNATFTRFQHVRKASADISRKAISNCLGVDTSKFDDTYFGWRECDEPPRDIVSYLQNSLALLKNVYSVNLKMKIFTDSVLKAELQRQWTISTNTVFITSFFDNVDYDTITKYEIVTAIDKAASLFSSYKKVIIYGTGQHSKEVLGGMNNYPFEIVGVCDSNTEKHGTRFFNWDIISPHCILEKSFDYILIASPNFFVEIWKYLISELEIDKDKIMHLPSLAAMRFFDREESRKRYSNEI